jgi:hypothetical protein
MKNYRNKEVKLVCSTTGKQLFIGDAITDFRGKETTIDNMRPPHKSSSVGFVNNFYASVFNTKFVEL